MGGLSSVWCPIKGPSFADLDGCVWPLKGRQEAALLISECGSRQTHHAIADGGWKKPIANLETATIARSMKGHLRCSTTTALTSSD